MSAPGSSRAMAAGLAVMLLSISAGIHVDGFGLLLCFVGVLAGTSLVVAGIRMADGPAPSPIAVAPMVLVSGGARALAAFVRCNTAAMGLLMASCAFTAVFGEESPALCFGTFALLLLGLTLLNVAVRGE